VDEYRFSMRDDLDHGLLPKARAYARSSFPSDAIDTRVEQHNIIGMMIVAELQKTLARGGNPVAGI
jgi:hypothetical protein